MAHDFQKLIDIRSMEEDNAPKLIAINVISASQFFLALSLCLRDLHSLKHLRAFLITFSEPAAMNRYSFLSIHILLQKNSTVLMG